MGRVTILFVATVAMSVNAHMAMQIPHTWGDTGKKFGMTIGKTCNAGCRAGGKNCNCLYFTNQTHISGQPTIPAGDLAPYGSMGVKAYGPGGDFTRRNPWRHPGTAPVNGPCGVGGGNPDGCPAGSGGATCPGGGYGNGLDATKDTWTNAPVTTWEAGGTVEAAYSIQANHAGGSQYRLCKLPAAGKKGLTEACFQKLPLRFGKQFLQAGPDGERVEISPMDVSSGTVPAGSTWRRSPVPACKDAPLGSGGAFGRCTGPMFTPPVAKIGGQNAYGFGNKGSRINFSVVDQLLVPADLAPGRYVLSWRFDCEQTPQVWNNCADIEVTASGQGGATPAPAPSTTAPPAPAPSASPEPDPSKCTDRASDCCGSATWGEPQTCSNDYEPIPVDIVDGSCPTSSYTSCPAIGCYGCYPPAAATAQTTTPAPGAQCVDGLFSPAVNFCSEWCNAAGFWGCGVGTMVAADGRNTGNTDYSCDCAGCNGCRAKKAAKRKDGDAMAAMVYHDIDQDPIQHPTLVETDKWEDTWEEQA